MLNNMFTAFDRLCDTLGVYKVETIGKEGSDVLERVARQQPKPLYLTGQSVRPPRTLVGVPRVLDD